MSGVIEVETISKYKISFYFKSDCGNNVLEYNNALFDDIHEISRSMIHKSIWMSKSNQDHGCVIDCADVSHFFWSIT